MGLYANGTLGPTPLSASLHSGLFKCHLSTLIPTTPPTPPPQTSKPLGGLGPRGANPTFIGFRVKVRPLAAREFPVNFPALVQHLTRRL